MSRPWARLLVVAALAHGAPAAAAAEPHAPPSATVAAGITGLTAAAVISGDPEVAKRADAWMRALAPGWTPNRGQVAGADGRAVGDVLYSLRTPRVQLHVTRRGLTAFFTGRRDDPGERPWSTVGIELVGATIRPEAAQPGRPVEALGEQHFYAPHCPDGVLGVPSYERITFRDVYPGIDWVLVADRGGALHQDFVVRPGADPGRIRLRYRGARSLRLDPDGRTLRIRTALGEVSEGPLRCHQEPDSAEVPARFRLQGDLLSVSLGAWDRTRPLTIDPPLLWSTLYGGGGYDGPRSIHCDNLNGDVYVVGYTASTNLPCTSAPGPYLQLVSNPHAPPDAFIWKFTQQGVRTWATYYSGGGAEYANDCAVDRLGNLYVVGETSSTDFPTLQRPGAYWQPASGGGIDAFVLRFDSQGVRQWATYYGGSLDDQATGVATDSTDRVFVAGYTGSANLPLANPGGGAYYQSALDGASDGFLLKFDTLGALTWGTYLGGDAVDRALGVAVNASALYVSGLTFSTVFPTLDPPGNADYFQGASGGAQDAFLSRFTLGGVQTWSTFYGGSGFEEAREPAITPAGDVYFVGVTNSGDLPVFNPNPIQTPNQPAYFQGTMAGSFDLFMLRFTPANVRRWATFLGGTGIEDLARGSRNIVVDSQGRLHLTAASSSNDFPFVNPGGGAHFQGSTANSDVVYARFATTDSLTWGTFFGGSGASFGTSVAIGVDDCLFAAGEFQGTGFTNPPPAPAVGTAWFVTTPSGDDDGFVSKFCHRPHACCIELTCVAVSGAAECAARGGTAYHPDQTCAQTNCTILCTICGRKFADLDRDGVQDGGEPGLAGWTIQLRDPGGQIVATAVTGANGDYCFDDVPCGTYRVTEAVQSGWVKIAPAGAGHLVSPPINTTVNGVDFGNYACPPVPPCNPMPPGLSAWWPFDDGPGAVEAADVTHVKAARNRAELLGGAVGGAGSLCLPGPAAAARVPASGQSGLDFGAGSFGVSVWISPDAGAAGGRVVAEKRGAAAAGWALYLDGTRCMLSLSAGAAPQIVVGPDLPAGSWSHVAVSVDRSSGAGRWFLNGSPFAADFTPIAGSLDNGADLWIGQSDPATGVGPGLQGCLAQLALFHAPVSADMAAKAFGPGPPGVPVPWCPDYAVLPAVRAVCSSQSSVQICFSLGNRSAAPVTYSWSLADLPAGPGCTYPGPTQFSVGSDTVTVPGGSVSAPICVTVTRPNGFTQQGATACFALTFVNHTTGVCRTRSAKIRVDNSCWCGTTIPTAVVPVPAGGRVIPFAVKRPCDPIALPYRIVARDPHGGGVDAEFVSLQGAAPGMPYTGTLSAGHGSEATTQVHVAYPGGPDAALFHELVLEADTDGDGVREPLASTFVMPAAAGDPTGVPAGTASKPLMLRSSPNPFAAGCRPVPAA